MYRKLFFFDNLKCDRRTLVISVKTPVIDVFSKKAARSPSILISAGRCIYEWQPHLGASEKQYESQLPSGTHLADDGVIKSDRKRNTWMVVTILRVRQGENENGVDPRALSPKRKFGPRCVFWQHRVDQTLSLRGRAHFESALYRKWL